MTTAGEQVIAEVLTDMRLHGFTKLRATTHGTLYGFDRFRLSLPHNVPDKGHNSRQTSLRKQWENLKSEMYEALPGYKQRILDRLSQAEGMSPSEVENMQPIPSPDDPPLVVKATENGHEPWTCPKCDRTFKTQGRHATVCDGTKAIRTGPGRYTYDRSKRTQSSSTSEVRELLTKLGDLIMQLEKERDSAVRRLERVQRSLA